MVLIVDYGMSNLRSVAKALERIGTSVRVSSRPTDVERAEKLILPGVGAFGDAMKELRKRKLFLPLKRAITRKKPFLGICLGLQLLFESSEESAGVAGLGVLPGRVVRFRNRAHYKVPHMGWNQLEIRRRSCPILRGIQSGLFVYFVHSYYVVPSDKALVLANTNYGLRFTSMVWKEQIFGVQFHPEKSQQVGLKIIENFVRM